MSLNSLEIWKTIRSKKTTLAFFGIFFLATLAISNNGVSAYELQAYPDGAIETYDVTIDAYCLTEDTSVNVMVRMDEGDWQPTPYTFADLMDSHTFEVNSTDSNDHPFAYWGDNNTLTSPIRTISSGGNCMAVYFEPTVEPELLEVKIDINPDALNLGSHGKFITVYIELPAGYNVKDIDLSTVELEGITAITNPKYGFVTDPVSCLVDHDGDGIIERMVKFDRAAVQDAVKKMIGEEGTKFDELELTVIGELLDGTPFEGSYSIKVINHMAMKSLQARERTRYTKRSHLPEVLKK